MYIYNFFVSKSGSFPWGIFYYLFSSVFPCREREHLSFQSINQILPNCNLASMAGKQTGNRYCLMLNSSSATVPVKLRQYTSLFVIFNVYFYLWRWWSWSGMPHFMPRFESQFYSWFSLSAVVHPGRQPRNVPVVWSLPHMWDLDWTPWSGFCLA